MIDLRERAGDEEGFSLIELLVVVTLLSIIGGALVSGLTAGYRTTVVVDNRVQAVTDLQRALEYVGRNVRVADSVGNGAIRPSTSTQLDLDVYQDDAAGSLTRVRFTYTLVPSVEFSGLVRLRETRAVWNDPESAAAGYQPAATRFLVDGVDPLIPMFAYFDEEGSPMASVTATNAQDVTEVVLTVDRRTRDPRNPERSVEVTTRVALRNAGT
jgi:prepilin-type N-terminal cleavage/methylation domain-containing protein